MITTENGLTTITCDKCKDTSTASEGSYNDVFFKEGWVLNDGRKYEHLCYSCLPAKQRKRMIFIKDKFNL